MDTGTDDSQKRKAYTIKVRKAYTIKVKLTAIAHTIYRVSFVEFADTTNYVVLPKKFITLVWQVDNVLIEAGSPI